MTKDTVIPSAKTAILLVWNSVFSVKLDKCGEVVGRDSSSPCVTCARAANRLKLASLAQGTHLATGETDTRLFNCSPKISLALLNPLQLIC